MAALCDAVIHLCAVRVTRLDTLGNPSPGPNNVYVTSNQIQLIAKPQVETGADRTLVGGCDCIIASYRGYDKLKRFDLEMDLGLVEPGLLEMLTGGSAIIKSAAPIGMWFPNQLDCAAPVQPNVCVEGWQDLWADDHAESGASGYRYMHWIFPSSRWQLSDVTMQNDFNQPKVMGYTRSNPNWGLGIYGDLPEAAQPLGGFFYDTKIPVAACGYQTKSTT